MLQKLLITSALVGAALPALAQQQGTPQEPVFLARTTLLPLLCGLFFRHRPRP